MVRPAPTPADCSVDIGIVCELDLESAPLIRRLHRPRHTSANRFVLVDGAWGDRRVAVVRSGSGLTRLSVAAESLLSVHQPRTVLAVGFASGLDEVGRTGDVIVPSEVVDGSDGCYGLDVHAACFSGLSVDVRAGRLVSIADIPRQAAGKRQLHGRTGAVAADHQSATLARMCRDRGIRFASVRIFTDDATHDTAPESVAVYHSSRSFRWGGMVGALWSGRGRMSRIWKIRAAASQLADQLATVVAQTLSRL